MDLIRLGTALRAIRIAKGLRLDDLAARSGVSRTVIARFERGEAAGSSLRTLDALARGLDATVDVFVRWHGADLQRLVNAEHSALHEAVAALAKTLNDWEFQPEISFSVFGERGVIDWLAWHPATRTLLVIELKTAIVDVNELLGTFDRKRRLAVRVARERGWDPVTVSSWLIFSERTRNRSAVERHRRLFDRVFPSDGHVIRSWLRRPVGSVHALSFLLISRPEAATRRRVRQKARTCVGPSVVSTAGPSRTGSAAG
jgi:transcriptional regulator with XRE-family HTH domain